MQLNGEKASVYPVYRCTLVLKLIKALSEVLELRIDVINN